MTTIQDNTGCVYTERGSLMQLGEGRVFYPLDPRAEEVNIKDIARSLSRIIRFNGHSDLPVSVAQHSVQCLYLAQMLGYNAEVQRYMLLHDAAESYIGDMIRPLKVNMPDFCEAERKVWKVIVEALNIAGVPNRIVNNIDNIACAWEKRDMFKSAMPWTGMPDIEEYDLAPMHPWSSIAAERIFLNAYKKVTEECDGL